MLELLLLYAMMRLELSKDKSTFTFEQARMRPSSPRRVCGTPFLRRLRRYPNVEAVRRVRRGLLVACHTRVDR